MGQMTPEQQKELEEKLKKMSPEELAEFQKSQCIFCQIVSGNIPSRTVYKDENVVAVLDINPAVEGHLLVMPVKHHAVMPQMPKDEIVSFFSVVKKLSHLVIKVLGVEGTSVFIANGGAAGQRANHFMAHIIPRKTGDGIPLSLNLKDITTDVLAENKKKLAALFTGKPSEGAKEVAEESKSDEPVQQKEETGKEPEEKKSDKADLDAIAELLSK